MLIAVFGSGGVRNPHSLIGLCHLESLEKSIHFFLLLPSSFLLHCCLSFFLPPPQGHYERKYEAGDQFYITESISMCGRDVPMKIVCSLVHMHITRTNVVTSSLSRNCNDLVWREREGEGGREMLLSLHDTFLHSLLL